MEQGEIVFVFRTKNIMTQHQKDELEKEMSGMNTDIKSAFAKLKKVPLLSRIINKSSGGTVNLDIVKGMDFVKQYNIGDRKIVIVVEEYYVNVMDEIHKYSFENLSSFVTREIKKIFSSTDRKQEEKGDVYLKRKFRSAIEEIVNLEDD